LFARHGIDAASVRLFPVSKAQLGAPPASLWQERREAVQRAVNEAPTGEVRRLGMEYLGALTDYEREAAAAGASFVEIQNTMLFATVGNRLG
jgi:hypothetical protein